MIHLHTSFTLVWADVTDCQPTPTAAHSVPAISHLKAAHAGAATLGASPIRFRFMQGSMRFV